jgi:4-hydroxy-tetrahydrodipicolinate synthase
VQAAFAAHGITDVRQSTARMKEGEVAAQAIADGCTTLVAVGGDGTWSNVANAILRGVGVISVASNVAPGEVSKLVRTFRAGDAEGARVIAQRLRPLFEALFLESSPGPVKSAMAILGRLEPEIRLPLVLASERTQVRLRAVLGELGLR